MTVLSTRHRGEESRKDYDGFYHMQTPTNSVPDLRSLNGDVRRHSRRPSVRSHRRGSSRQDGMAEVPCTPRSAPPSIRSHRPSASTHGRPGDASLIPELPKFTHRIHLDGRGSEVVSSNPLHGSIDTTSSPVSSAPHLLHIVVVISSTSSPSSQSSLLSLRKLTCHIFHSLRLQFDIRPSFPTDLYLSLYAYLVVVCRNCNFISF
jgi:hypothetical protein